MHTPDVLEQARSITQEYGRGFYRASFLFDREIREAIWILYAFVRIPDEMVDTELDKEKGRRELAAWRADWDAVIRSDNTSAHPILTATKEVFDRYSIPFVYVQDFLDAMESDFTFTRLHHYHDLEQYMYGSAVVPGLMISHIIGFDEGALPHARALGESFQLVNFIRDAGDDYRERGRVYFPQDECARFGIDESYFKIYKGDTKWTAFMEFQIQRTEVLLQRGVEGIPFLHPKGRRAVYASALLYKALLRKIKINNYDTITKRTTVGALEKTMILLKALCKRNL